MKDFFYNTKRKVLHFLSDIRVYPYPAFIILWGDISYKVKSDVKRMILDEIEPGDVLLRRYSNYLGSIFIKGYWSHAAVFDGPNTVIHMLGNGIVREDILKFMNCDDIAILRYNKGIEKIQDAIDEVRNQLTKGVEYDYDFNTETPEKFYCTELISYIYNLNYPKNKIIFPDQFLTNPDFNIIYPGIKSHNI